MYFISEAGFANWFDVFLKHLSVCEQNICTILHFRCLLSVEAAVCSLQQRDVVSS